MAFLRIENKKSGKYLRIIQSYRENGKIKHKTLHSLGKVEDYPPGQLQAIAKKLLELSGTKLEDIVGKSFHEIERVNYGYALIIKRLWKLFKMDIFAKKVQSKVQFDWVNIFQIMISERMNDPASKLQNFFNAKEYFGFNSKVSLQHFYRTLDILYENQDFLKKHIFEQRSSLFSEQLDVIFYDVTTLYFDSQKEEEDNLRQKGYSKDGKSHKTQIVLGLLVDKMRNPISYQIYKGNTYEGHTMIDALKRIKKKFRVQNIIVVADSAMIDKNNRDFMNENSIEYILGERLKNLPEKVKSKLLDKSNHHSLFYQNQEFTYAIENYNGRKIICTYSAQRAKKDAYEREKLIEKAQYWINNPSKYRQVKKRGAGRFICLDKEGVPVSLDMKRIKADAIYDGYKAIATTTQLSVSEILSKYSDLFEVEHAFRALKSQIEIRPVFHWTNKRIEGHIAMCFTAFCFLNFLRNATLMQYKDLIRTIDKMQLSVIKEDRTEELIYMRSKIDENVKRIVNKLKLVVPNDITPQKIINQYFM